MTEAPDVSHSAETGTLIDHILTRYHAVHRSEFNALQSLAARVEAVHADDEKAPEGLAEALVGLVRDMEDHMAREEVILFPAMRSGGMRGIERPIAAMRADHDGPAGTIAVIRRIAGNLAPPDHACRSWRALYAGIEKLLDDPASHPALENDVLFPRFEQA